MRAVGLLLLVVLVCVVVGLAAWRWRSKLGAAKFGDALRHPFAIAAVTALFSGVVASGVIRLWQNHDKELDIQRIHAEQELELKSRLVRDMGAASSSFVGAAASVSDRRSLDSAYRNFQVDSARVGSQLAAYFPEGTVARWAGHSESLRYLYELVASPPGNARNLWLARLSRYLRIQTINIDGLCFSAKTSVYQVDLRKLTLHLQEKERQAVEYVVSSGSALTDKSAVPAPTRLPSPGPIDRHPCARYFP